MVMSGLAFFRVVHHLGAIRSQHRLCLRHDRCGDRPLKDQTSAKKNHRQGSECRHLAKSKD